MSYKVLDSIWAYEEMSFLIFVALASEKYLDRNFFAIYSQVVINPRDSELSLFLSRFLNEK